MRKFALYTLNRFLTLLKDNGAIMILIVAPIFYSFFYPSAYLSEVARDIPVAVVDEDKTEMSRNLTRMLEATQELSIVRNYTAFQEAKEDMLIQKVHGIIYIPRDFQKDILNFKTPALLLYLDGSYMLYYKQVTMAATKAAGTFSAGVKIKRLSSSVPYYAIPGYRAPVSANVHYLFNPAGGYGSYVVPAVFILILQQLLLITIGMQAGTVREFRSRQKRRRAVFATFMSYLVVYGTFGLIHTIYFLGFSFNFYTFPAAGSILNVFLFLLPYYLAIIGIAIAIGSLFKERESAILFFMVTSIPMLFLSGVSWPVFAMPQCVKFLRLLIPSSLGIEGFLKIYIEGAALSDIKTIYLQLWGLAAFYVALALVAIKKQRLH